MMMVLFMVDEEGMQFFHLYLFLFAELCTEET